MASSPESVAAQTIILLGKAGMLNRKGWWYPQPIGASSRIDLNLVEKIEKNQADVNSGSADAIDNVPYL